MVRKAERKPTIVTDAVVLALQAQGIDESAKDFERRFGPLTREVLRLAMKRRREAKRR